MKKSLIYKILYILLLSICNLGVAYASKYTIVNGKEFNNRIKLAIDSNSNSASPDYSITAFKNSPNIKGNPIDISEDGDSSVLACIEDGVIYLVSDEDVYLNSDASFMFDKFINLKEVDLTYLNFDKTRKMNFMFSNCIHLSNLDMDNDTTIRLDEMQGMFFNCQSLIDLHINMLNTKNVKNMNSLFYNCVNLKNIYVNVSNWSIEKVNNFNKMFYDCKMLKTNYNLKATSIDESKYKTYAVAGSEFREGLLRDYDYDYDEFVNTSETVKVDKSSDAIIEASENTNIKSNINNTDIENSKKFLNVQVSSRSEFYEQISDDRISLDGKMNKDKYKNADTLDDVPILRDETTFVDKLVPKKSSNSNTIKIASPSSPDLDDSKGLLRPSYNVVDEETGSIEVEDKVLEPEVYKTDFISENLQSIMIFVGIVLVISAGIFIFIKKDKNDDIDF